MIDALVFGVLLLLYCSAVNQGVLVQTDSETGAWLGQSRRFLLWLGGGIAVVLTANLLYFLWGHEYLETHQGAGEAVGRVLGEPVNNAAGLIVTVDTFVTFASVAFLLLMLLVGILIWRPAPPPRVLVRRACLVIATGFFYAAVCQIVVFASLRRPGFHNWSSAGWDRIMEFSGFERQASRVFMPLLIRGTAAVLPAHKRAELSRKVKESSVFMSLSRASGGKAGYELELAIAFFYQVLFLVLALIFLGNLASQAYTGLSFLHTRMLIPLLFALCLPLFFKNTTYVYDMSNICMITLGFWLLLRGNPIVFCAVFATALLNKESFILTSFVFLVLYWKRLPLVGYVVCLGFQGSYFIILKLLLKLRFGDNPGDAMIYSYAGSNRFVREGNIWTFFTETGYTAYFFHYIFLLAIPVLALLYWREKHRELRVALLTAAAVLIPVNYLLTVVWEWRGYYELYPLAFLLAYETLVRLQGEPGQRPFPLQPRSDSFGAWVEVRLRRSSEA